MFVHDNDIYNIHNRQRSASLSDNDHSKQKLKYNINPVPIGSGTFAKVYHGVDKFGNDVAIKRIKITSVSNKMLEKFLFELHISTVLKNENIVECIETFKTSRHWYIVTEYCDVGTFSDIITLVKNTDGIINKEVNAKIYLSQLKDAMKYLRNVNVIHRDLKPQNILLKTVNKNGKKTVVVKLADFGFARHFNKDTQQNDGCDDMVTTICGSPIYMAPEMLIDNKYNMKADLWSFGVIMYETMFGFCPFNYPKNISQLCEKIKNHTVTYPIDYSSECIDLIKLLLTTEPKNRITWDDFFNHAWFSDNNTLNTYVKPHKNNQNVDDIFNMEPLHDDNNENDDNNFNFNIEPLHDENVVSSNVLLAIEKAHIYPLYVNDFEMLNKHEHIIRINGRDNISEYKDYIMVDYGDLNINEMDGHYKSQISFTGSVINIIETSLNVIRSGMPRSI